MLRVALNEGNLKFDWEAAVDGAIILIIVGSIIILSYLANVLSKKIKLPSVVILLTIGILLKFFGEQINLILPDLTVIINILGTIGIVLIVLEAVIELRITKENRPVFVKASLAALFTIVLSTAAFAFIFSQFLTMDLKTSLIFAVPLSILSSAIVIPSVANVKPEKREFLTIESTVSDIIGMVLFNFLITDENLNLETAGLHLLGLVAVAAFAIIASFFLIFLMQNNKHKIKYFLIFGFLILFYGVGKSLHQPILIVVMLFGIILSNIDLLKTSRLGRFFEFEKLKDSIETLKLINGEISFIVRTFFFILFGMLINFNSLLNPEVLLIGGIVLLIQYLVRTLSLLPFVRQGLISHVLTSPRGLITVLLFYSIPGRENYPIFASIIFFVIAASILIMTMSLLMTKKSLHVELIE